MLCSMNKKRIRIFTTALFMSVIIMAGGIRMMTAAIRQTHGSGLMEMVMVSPKAITSMKMAICLQILQKMDTH